VEPESGGDRHPFLARRLASSPGYLRRVEAAERLGVPLSKLEGREPAEVTEHEYADGVLVRSVTTREPAWTEQDFAEVLALAEYRESLCECCGLPKKDVDTRFVHERDAPKFVVSRHTCLARRDLVESQVAFEKQHEKKPRPEHKALLWSVRIEKR
jgi:hypothetical protein